MYYNTTSATLKFFLTRIARSFIFIDVYGAQLDVQHVQVLQIAVLVKLVIL